MQILGPAKQFIAIYMRCDITDLAKKVVKIKTLTREATLAIFIFSSVIRYELVRINTFLYEFSF